MAPTKHKLPLTTSHTGAYRVTCKDGKPISIEGFEHDPEPSPIGQSMIDSLNSRSRIAKPAIRKSWLDNRSKRGRESRGKDSFVEVEWDFALDLVAEELNRVRDKHSNEAIYAGSYGWASAGRFHHAQSQLRRFMNLFGGSTTSKDSYSYSAGEVILPHVVGSMAKMLINHTSWKSISKGANLVVGFGGMARRNAQLNSGGTGKHQQHQDMLSARDAGVEFVNVSPIESDIAPELNADWVSIRPNTDVALMLGIAHTLVTNKLHDAEFLNRYCQGYEAFQHYVLGINDGQAKDCHWAAEITGIPSHDIEQLAHRMASAKTMLNVSWSLTRQQNGEHAYWMVVVLAAMLGNIGKTGLGFGIGLGAVNAVGKHRFHLPWAAFPTGSNPIDTFIPVARITDMLNNPGTSFQYNGNEYTYPDIKLVYWAGGNPFHHHQNLNRFRKAWENVETVIVHETAWNSLAKHADIVLPATVSLERSDIAGSPRDNYLFAMEQVSQPFDHARTDHDIFKQLAARLTASDQTTNNFEDTFTENKNSEQWIRSLYNESKQRGEDIGVDLPEYDQFLATGFFVLDEPDQSATLLEAFRQNPIQNPLNTPSGLIEIFSETIANFKLCDNPGHPVWNEPSEWLGSSKAIKHPFHLITHQPERRLHSQLDDSAHSRAGKIHDREPCRMNPDDAALRHIADGDFVKISNERGSLISVVCIDPSIRNGVVAIATGAWFDPDWEHDSNCCKHGNPNVLTSDMPTSELAQGPCALTCLVNIVKYEGQPPAVTAFDPPILEKLTTQL